MEIVYEKADLERYMREAVQVSNDSPVLLDRFLDDAIEVDVDAVCDGEQVVIGGIMEHIEQAGVHSGDSASSLPAYSLKPEIVDEIRRQVKLLGKALKVVGLMNAQLAVKDDEIYIIEVNPRASRSVPFVAKATGVPLAKIGARVMAGEKLADIGFTEEVIPQHFSVKESVFPFLKFANVDPLLGPEMRSTGEVMGTGKNFAQAFAKGSVAAGDMIHTGGTALISVRKRDRAKAVELARRLIHRGFKIMATRGTGNAILEAGLECDIINKVTEGRPNVVDAIKNGQIDLIVNTSDGSVSVADSYSIRREALMHKIVYTTTMAAAFAMEAAMDYMDQVQDTYSLQELH